MKKIVYYARNIVIVLLLSVVFVVTYIEYMNSDASDISDHFYRLTAGWSIYVDGYEYHGADLETLIPKQQNRRSLVDMRIRIPEDAKIENPILKIYTIHSGFDVFLDSDLLMYHGMWETARHEVVGMGYSYIRLPDNYAGRNLRIRLYVNEDNAFTSIKSPEIYDNKYIFTDFIKANIIPLSINIFLLVFGVVVFPLSIIYSARNQRFKRLTYVALFSLNTGLWSICSYDHITLFTYNIKVKAYLEFISLYSAPLYTLLYFREDVKGAPKWIRYFTNFTMILQVAYILAGVVLVLFNITHLPAMLSGEHAIMVLIAINAIIDIVYSIRNDKHNRKAIIIGLGIFIAVAISDLVRFDLQKYYFSDRVFNYVSIICIGVLLFIVAQIIDFCQELSINLTEQLRQQTLENMAYTDTLTHLANRRKCDEICRDADLSDEVYGILSFDLNNLKKVNDNEGHEKGDLLICSFAEVLKETYDKYGIVCRVGGDEFLVLFPNMKKVDINKLEKQLHINISKKNKENHELNISTAYGFCDNSSNREWKCEDIYREADKRMYENKIAMKAQRV